MKQRFIYKITSLLLFFCLNGPLDITAQSTGIYIYGTITTLDGEEFTGYLRWGKEEMYWHDIFNSVKTKNFKPSTKEPKNKSNWKDLDWSLSGLWREEFQNSSHTFACFFGDIASMKIKRGERVTVRFKNGSELDVNGGSNDIGARISMHEYELGKITFDWDDLANIEFSQAPAGSEIPYGKPLYGTVYTKRKDKYTGHIKWDLDERNGQDILDGKTRLGSQKIPFEKITNIEKVNSGQAVDLTFESGRTMVLDGSNDCDSGNRGIAVYLDEIGSIEVDWSDFQRLDLSQDIPNEATYNDFGYPNGIQAEIITFDGHSYSGYIAFDKDELWDFEFVDGDENEIEFQVPIRNIKSITPKNRSFSVVELKSGDIFYLGDRQDVSSSNDGILIFKESANRPKEVQWDDIEVIHFK